MPRFINNSHSKPISIREHQERLAFDITSKELSVLQILKIRNILKEIDGCDKQGKHTGFKTNG